jgi:hypothetical protein
VESEARARRWTYPAQSPNKAADTIRVATLLAIAASPQRAEAAGRLPRNAINSWQSNLTEPGIQPRGLPTKLAPERVAFGSVAAGGRRRVAVVSSHAAARI